MKLWLASVVAAVLVTAGSAVAADAPAAPVTIKAKNGEVTFNHKTHAAQKCTVCHQHDKGFAADETNCVNCHYGTGDVDDFGAGTAASLFGNNWTSQIDSAEWTWSGHGKSSGTSSRWGKYGCRHSRHSVRTKR